MLLVRDGVTLAPDAVSVLVDDALDSDAGVVGPKILDRDRPGYLADVGGTVDRLGVLTPTATLGELDQMQHDGERDTFVATAGAMLVRADTFAEIGGFDPLLDGDHVDLCWRAQMSGRRVRVVPGAVGRQPMGRAAPSAALPS
ncbi:MAG TPA: glycosyl transferase, partial [Acidimicrobiaceae bacterium]|nr:glycosyl transferase [Acidimicrobiaceae bacterium]